MTGNKFKAEFKIVLDSLNDAGYKNYWAVLNAKDYGIPQNRERVFIISIRKDIDHGFNFPEPYELKLKLADLLEETVDEKYYLTEKQIESFIDQTVRSKAAGNGFKFAPTDGKGIAKTVTTRAGSRKDDNFLYTKEPRCVQVGDLNHYKNDQMNRVYSPDGISPTLTAVSGGGREAKIAVRVGKQTAQTLLTNDANGVVVKTTRNADIASTIRSTIYKQGSRNLIKNVKDGGGYEGVIEYHQGTIIDDTQGFDGVRKYDDYSPSLRASRSGLKTVDADLRIRKLTPKECFRLMGFDDRDVDILIENGISNTQLYKMVGNSIVVDVLEEIYCELLNSYRDVI